MSMDAAQLEKSLSSVLSWWDEAGVETPALAPPKPKKRASLKREPVRPAGKTKAARPAAPLAAAPHDALIKAAEVMAEKCKSAAELKAAIEKFNAGTLSDGARGAVVSRGNPSADIMVIGEAPGAQEDAAGKPFIGPAGQLLDKIFASIGLNEDTLYITNVCNWHPASHRKPNDEEIAICLPIIRRHIALIQPKIIVLIGGASMAALTKLKGITKSRGSWENINVKTKDGEASIPALITYHPAYLLRQPHLKRDVWRDMLSLKAKIDEL